ncbi:hypothetical protein GCM10007424_17810 [Flavobacterium suaedae]|uniref:Tetratricopeptide repeat protein n=1 Tax=Flavobacterium suaedae TaxID=1767027 RepID=A0ABQ1JVU5_9FLAO|nr:hypothetical protein [Flavobacterium suaedae]GGB78149.1 hypothetical protein GCM10007424_17810 [Flavobacterium suaedae]
MNAIDEVVSIMSISDKKAFISYLDRKNKRSDVHNIDFFKILETDDINRLKNKYKDKKSADVYHALRKRIYDSLIAFMANRAFANDTSEEHEVLKLIVVARLFLEHKLYKTAFKCLRKAEVKATALEQFNLLNEIYHTQIQYAHIEGAPELESLTEKFKQNREKLHREEQLNLGYAILRKELSEIQHKGKIVDFRGVIKNTMESLGVSLNDVLTFKSLYQILFIANEYASINNNFGLIAPFIERSLTFISNKKELTGRHLYYHIYILYFIANIHFRNRNFSVSMDYLNQMDIQMQAQNGKYKKRFFLRWSLLRALNEHYSGNADAAITIAKKALSQQKSADPVDSNDLKFCLVVFYLQHSDKTAFKYIRAFAHTDSWYEKRMGMDWTIKKVLVEILLYAEFDNTEQALYRIKSFKRRYKKYLVEVNEERVLAYLQFVEKYIAKPELATSETFQIQLQTLLQESEAEHDVFTTSFVGWLMAKVNKAPVYTTILELLNKK